MTVATIGTTACEGVLMIADIGWADGGLTVTVRDWLGRDRAACYAPPESSMRRLARRTVGKGARVVGTHKLRFLDEGYTGTLTTFMVEVECITHDWEHDGWNGEQCANCCTSRETVTA